MAAKSWNKVELMGNLTRDPEIRYTPSGSAVATFTVATNRSFVTEGERKEEVDFHKIVAWAKLAELCSQLLKKGYRVFVSGRLQNRTWEDQTGQTRNTTEIVIDDMILLTNKTASSSEEVAAEPSEAKPATPAASKPAPTDDTSTTTKKVSADEDVTKDEPVGDEALKESPSDPNSAKATMDRKASGDKEDIDADDLPF